MVASIVGQFAIWSDRFEGLLGLLLSRSGPLIVWGVYLAVREFQIHIDYIVPAAYAVCLSIAIIAYYCGVGGLQDGSGTSHGNWTGKVSAY